MNLLKRIPAKKIKMNIFIKVFINLNKGLPSGFLPPFQPRDIPGKEPGSKSRKTHFLHLAFYKVLHAAGSNIGQGKGPILVAPRTVHQVNASICIGAAAFFITLQRHAAGLAKFIDLLHNKKS